MDERDDDALGPFAEVRRRLAKLFASVTVMSAGDDAFEFPSHIHRADLDSQNRLLRWGHATGMLTSASVVSRTSAPGEPSAALRIDARLGGDSQPPVTVANPAVHSAHYSHHLPASVQLVAATENLPKVLQPDVTRPDSARVSGLLIPTSKAPKIKLLPVKPVKTATKEPRNVQIGVKLPALFPVTPDINAQLYMERRRLPMPPRGSAAEDTVYPTQRKALAAAANLPEDDIKLVGVYCDVPLGAASQMEYDEVTGSLHLTLRDNAAAAILRLQRPVVTLILGKVKATGKVVRAFV